VSDVSRRDFVSTSSKVVLGGMIVPRHVLVGVRYRAPSDTLNVAIVGAGGMGAENAQELGSENRSPKVGSRGRRRSCSPLTRPPM
jgi:hypothetical protein